MRSKVEAASFLPLWRHRKRLEAASTIHLQYFQVRVGRRLRADEDSSGGAFTLKDYELDGPSPRRVRRVLRGSNSTTRLWFKITNEDDEDEDEDAEPLQTNTSNKPPATSNVPLPAFLPS
jgi:hypothetical protein